MYTEGLLQAMDLGEVEERLLWVEMRIQTLRSDSCLMKVERRELEGLAASREQLIARRAELQVAAVDAQRAALLGRTA